MLKFFASNVVVSKGYQNSPAVKFSEKGDFVRFRVGQKVYDPRAEDNHRWINLTVKCFDAALVDRIRKMGLKEGSFINLSGRYDEDVWEDEESKEKRSMPCIILDEIEFSGGGNGKKAMTVLGAVGGGFAGHEIEKQARATTVYKVHVRMDDGTTRTVTQSTAPTVGARIQL